MNDRVAHFALVAAGSCVLAVVGFVVPGSLEFFAPCRVVYRMHQAVQDSLACQSYAAIGLFSLLLFLAAGILAVVTGVLMFARRRAASSDPR